MCRSWLSPHALHGHIRIEQLVPRFRSASSALRAFSLGSAKPRQVFNVSVVAFATCTSRPHPHRATRTSISLRFIRSARFLTRLGKTSPSVQCVGRGFRHMHFTATSASGNAYLDSAPLHLGRGFRHMHRKEERTSGMQAFLSPLLFSVRVAQCLT